MNTREPRRKIMFAYCYSIWVYPLILFYLQNQFGLRPTRNGITTSSIRGFQPSFRSRMGKKLSLSDRISLTR